MDMPKFTTGEELYEYLTKKLELNDHSIVFHLIEPADEIGPGLISTCEQLNDDDAFDAIACRLYDEPFIDVEVTTFMIGEHESDSASYDEIVALEQALRDSKDAFNSMLSQYADVLCYLPDLHVANPAYEEDEDEQHEE